MSDVKIVVKLDDLEADGLYTLLCEVRDVLMPHQIDGAAISAFGKLMKAVAPDLEK
jgi:hypothetical protein